jgi:N-formylglutamate deformylase
MQVFTLHLPRASEVPIVANLPHSGEALPAESQARFLPEFLQQLPNTDWYLDRLYQFLPDLGITVLQANYSRYCVDLNRRVQEPLLGNFWQSVVPAQTAYNQSIYQTLPSPSEVAARVETYYLPYYQQLTALLEAKIAQFGIVYLLDLHSFYGLISDQICLGNANGQTCSEALITLVESQFQQQGYQVVRNKVFAGGHITRYYGNWPQVEALQIETRYTVYLNHAQLDQPIRPNWHVPEFEQAQTQFEKIFSGIVSQLI